MHRTVAWSLSRNNRAPQLRHVTAALILLLVCAPPVVWALSEAANREAREILEVAQAIRQADARAQDLRQRVEGVLQNLQRSDASAQGAVRGWTRAVGELRDEAARLRERRAALRIDALTAEQNQRAAASALRTYRDLNARLVRLEDAIAGTARAVEDVQARLKEQEAPSTPAPAAAAPRASAPSRLAESPPMDQATPSLSGVWRRASNRLWTIDQQPHGVVVLQRDHVPPDGMFDEYRGTISGLTVTLTHRVTAQTDAAQSMPPKVKQEVAGRGLTLTYRLTLSSDGRRLDGVWDQYTIGYDKKSLKITRITPRTDKVVLTRVLPDSGVFLPEPTASIRGSAPPPRGVLPAPDRVATVRAPNRADADANGIWTTETGKVALVQVRGQVRGLGIRFADGCRHDFEGQATRGEGGIVLRLRNSSTDPKCYTNLPPKIAASAIGKLSNDFEMTLDPKGHTLRGESVHDRVEFESVTNRILSVRKDDHWNVQWQRKAEVCRDPAAEKPPPALLSGASPAATADPPTLSPEEVPAQGDTERVREALEMQRQTGTLRTILGTVNRQYLEHARRLQLDLERQYRRTGNPVTRDVTREAEYIANHMVQEWAYHRDVLQWDGGYDENLARWGAIITEALSGGDVKWALDQYGVCANWQIAFLRGFDNLRPQPRHFAAVPLRAQVWLERIEHNAAGIVPVDRRESDSLRRPDRATLIDPWRSNGEWFHRAAAGDEWPWHVYVGAR